MVVLVLLNLTEFCLVKFGFDSSWNCLWFHFIILKHFFQCISFLIFFSIHFPKNLNNYHPVSLFLLPFSFFPFFSVWLSPWGLSDKMLLYLKGKQIKYFVASSLYKKKNSNLVYFAICMLSLWMLYFIGICDPIFSQNNDSLKYSSLIYKVEISGRLVFTQSPYTTNICT